MATKTSNHKKSQKKPDKKKPDFRATNVYIDPEILKQVDERLTKSLVRADSALTRITQAHGTDDSKTALPRHQENLSFILLLLEGLIKRK